MRVVELLAYAENTRAGDPSFIEFGFDLYGWSRGAVFTQAAIQFMTLG